MNASKWCHVGLAAGCLVIGCGIALPFLTILSVLAFAAGSLVIGGYVLCQLAWPDVTEEVLEEGDA